MARIYKNAFGRGPTKTLARLAGPDLLVVTLEGMMTAPERRLAALGEHKRLRETRDLLNHALEDEIRRVVGAILGRATLAFVSAIDPARDLAVLVFTLAP
jgi:uncharacterized protein YbcI